MCSCENKTGYSPLLVEKFEMLCMLCFINHIVRYTRKQHFSVRSYREMCYFPFVFFVKMLVCLQVCCQALVCDKRKKQEE